MHEALSYRPGYQNTKAANVWVGQNQLDYVLL